MGARGYVPQLGRFVQMDPMAGGSANPYAYTDGDPVNSSDLTGAYVESDYLGDFNSEWTVESRIAEEEAAREEAERKAEEAAAAAAAAAESVANNGAAKKHAKGKPTGKRGGAQATASIGCPALSCYPPKGIGAEIKKALAKAATKIKVTFTKAFEDTAKYLLRAWLEEKDKPESAVQGRAEDMYQRCLEERGLFAEEC
jgi:uncharacterized protein RhaS with RHS repeats